MKGLDNSGQNIINNHDKRNNSVNKINISYLNQYQLFKYITA